MAELTEAQVYAALGVEAPTPEPAAGSANEQAVAEPAQETEAPAAEAIEAAPSAADGAGEEKPAQTEDERRAFAAQRRRKEQQQAIDAAVAEAVKREREAGDARLKTFFDQAKLKNTITGEPITSMDEFDNWKKAFDEARLDKELKAGKLTKESLEQIINSNPIVQRANKIILERENEAEQARREAADARIAKQLDEISKMDPSIATVADLMNMENHDEFYKYVKQGNDFVSAYKLANFEKLTQQRTEAAKQQALNNQRSKAHLSATGAAVGTGNIPVPKDELAVFRTFMPNATDAEIEKYYNKYKKGQ